MRTPDALARLDYHQDRILATMARALALVARGPDAARGEIAKERWAAARLLREYQVFKHAEIFGPIMRAGHPGRAEQARHLAARGTAAGEQFQAYLRHWSARDIAAEWDAYKPAMLAMTARVRRTLAAERTGVAVLLAGTERTRMGS